MKIIVCIKQVPDPEGPPSSFVINEALNCVEPRGIPPVLSPFDENALEAALRIKDSNKDTVITVLSAGKKVANAVLIKALSAGADDLVKVEDDALDSASLDSHAAAAVLASAIKKIGQYDLILTGRQAADWNAGQTGIGIAEMLGVPAVTLARKLEIKDGTALIERLLPDGYETVKVALPAVIMVSNEIGQLRYPTMIQRRDAKKKPVTEWKNEDIGIASLARKSVLRRLYAPVMRKGQCVIVEGSSPEEAGKNLALKLRNDGIL